MEYGGGAQSPSDLEHRRLYEACADLRVRSNERMRASAANVKIEDYGDGIILAFAATLGLVVAFDATAAWFWRLFIFSVVTFTLGIVHPAVRFAWSMLSESRR
jgi:hypothetical protein